MTSGGCSEWGEVVFTLDVDQVMMNLVEHQQAALKASFLKGRPVEGTDHIRDAAGALIVANNKTSGASLNLFDLVDVPLSVRVT